MKKIISYTAICPLLILLVFISSCTGQQKQGELKNSSIEAVLDDDKTVVAKSEFINNVFSDIPGTQGVQPSYDEQIGEYVREVFEDRDGNLWFGTLARGVARHDGKTLTYFSNDDGLVGNQINGIAEDQEGNLWFSTTEGVSRFDGTTFVNFRTKDGLSDNSTWSILADSKGQIWVGTMGGLNVLSDASLPEGKAKFAEFTFPESGLKNPTFNFSTDLVWSMAEDINGNLWFGIDGLGVWKYNTQLPKGVGEGKSFRHFSKKDGLCSNAVMSVFADSKGNLWFGSGETRVPEKDNPYSFVSSADGGLSFFAANQTNSKEVKITRFPNVVGLLGKDIGPIYEDKSGNIWVASKHYGAFRFDGKSFTNYKEKTGQAIYNCVQSIVEDSKGNLWFGFSGGLFGFNGTDFYNITKNGPWK